MSLSVYTRIGAALALAGGLTAPVFSVVARSVPLTALALAAILLGAVALLLGRSLPEVPPRAAEAFLQAGLENVARLLEELGLDARAVYLPSRLSGGKPRALIPLNGHRLPVSIRPVQDRLIVDYGPEAEDVGLLVATPGSSVMMPASLPARTGADLEASLAQVLIGRLDVAEKVRVAKEDGVVRVTLDGLRVLPQDLWIYRAMGSPLASVAATVVAEGLDRPVSIRSEERRGGLMTIWLDTEP